MSSTDGRRDIGRIRALDGGRGAAMLMVFLSHFTSAQSDYAATGHFRVLRLVTLIASPAFVWISGMMLGILHHRNRDRFGPVRDRFIDRGLFLVLVTHPIIAGAIWLRAHTWGSALRRLFITDTLGICFVAGALLTPRLGARARALLGVSLLVGAWTVTAEWVPLPVSWAWQLKDILVGDMRAEWLGYGFPPVPWLGFFLVASAAGTLAAPLLEAGQDRLLVRAGMLVGAGAMVAAVALKAALWIVLRIAPPASAAPAPATLMHLVSFGEKIPPEPGYILFFGGLAVLVLTAVLAGERLAIGRAVNQWLGLFGRCSLVCFVAQFYVYYPAALRFPWLPRPLVPVYFLVTVLSLRALAAAWDRFGLNRLITVGYRGVARRAPRPGVGNGAWPA